MIIINLDLSKEEESKLKELIALSDKESICQLLASALVPTVENMLKEERVDDSFEVIANQLISEFADYAGDTLPQLSDYAVSREGIYSEHP